MKDGRFESQKREALVHPSNWELYKEPKKKKTVKVKFYRYHFIIGDDVRSSENYYITEWTTLSSIDYSSSQPLKTEERIETYEVDDE